MADAVEDEDPRAIILNAITIAESDRENKIAEIKASYGNYFPDVMQADMIAKSTQLLHETHYKNGMIWAWWQRHCLRIP